jgi:hypothetical protein
MEQVFYTSQEIRDIAINNHVDLNESPTYNSGFTFLRFHTTSGDLFAKQSVGRIGEAASYFLCNQFGDMT